MSMLKKLCRKGKEIEIWGHKNLHLYLEQKAELAVRGACAAQERFSEAEAHMEIRNWVTEVF